MNANSQLNSSNIAANIVSQSASQITISLTGVVPGSYGVVVSNPSTAVGRSNEMLFTVTAGSGGITGACGVSNNKSFSTAPTTDLCSQGTASTVSGTGPWTWTCTGQNGGTTASCSAVNALPLTTSTPTLAVFNNDSSTLTALEQSLASINSLLAGSTNLPSNVLASLQSVINTLAQIIQNLLGNSGGAVAPSLSVAPSTVSYPGSAAVVPTITVSNANSSTTVSTLLWKAATSGWCSVSPSSGAITGGNAILTISTASGRPASGSTCTVTVSDNGSSPAALNSPQNVTVTYGSPAVSLATVDGYNPAVSGNSAYTPNSAIHGTDIVLYGAFGLPPYNGTVMIDGNPATTTSESASEIEVPIPNLAVGDHAVFVVTSSGTTNTLKFSVTSTVAATATSTVPVTDCLGHPYYDPVGVAAEYAAARVTFLNAVQAAVRADPSLGPGGTGTPATLWGYYARTVDYGNTSVIPPNTCGDTQVPCAYPFTGSQFSQTWNPGMFYDMVVAAGNCAGAYSTGSVIPAGDPGSAEASTLAAQAAQSGGYYVVPYPVTMSGGVTYSCNASVAFPNTCVYVGASGQYSSYGACAASCGN